MVTTKTAPNIANDKIQFEWKSHTVADLVDFEGGSQPPLSTFSKTNKNGYVRLIQIRDYKSDKNITFIPRNLARKFCTKTDIMIGRYGPPIFQILRGLEGAYNVALIKAIPKGSLTSEYLYHFLTQESLFWFIEKLSQRSGGQTGIDIAELKGYNFPLPPTKAEQAAIATALSDVDALITGLEKLIAKKKAIKQGAMQDLLQPKEGWAKRTLGEIIFLSPKKESTNKDTLVTFLGMEDVSEDGKIIKQNVKTYQEIKSGLTSFKRGDVLVAKITPCFENGKGACLISLKTEFGYGSTEFHVLRPNTETMSQFVFYHTQTINFRRQLETEMTGTAGQKRVPSKSIKEYSLHVPDLKEQTRIAQILSDMDCEIAALEKKLEKQKKIKQGMMQSLLTGKIRLV